MDKTNRRTAGLIFMICVGLLLVSDAGAAASRGRAPQAGPRAVPAAPRQVGDPTGLQLVIAGDSITDGHYEMAGNPYAWWRDGWRIRAPQRICGIYCDGHVRIVPHGGGCLVAPNCGNPIPAVTWMYSDVLDVTTPKPTTVVLEIGINDILKATDQQMFAAYAQLYFDALARGIRLVIATITPVCFNFGGWPQFNDQIQRVNRWIRTQSGLPWVVDLNSWLQTSNGSLNPKYAMVGCATNTDPIHPNRDGVFAMTDALLAALII